ncbi:MAG: energy-coupling factor transporter transmembrane protein EcfT [Desulfobulbaceae bacterium]|nr:energy-coupling factor transporter transmembrane protein EcfT [Desulfobulbaceae bacterium]
MANTVAFNFRSGTSILHRLDPRFKIIFLALLSLSTLNAGCASLLVLTLLFSLLVVDIRLPLSKISFELRYFGVFLFIVFITRCLTEPGIPVFSFKAIIVTQQGVMEGGLASWRLALVILMSLLLSVSTRPKEIRTAVEILFKPIPFLPEKRIAVMIGLIVRFIPVILHLTREMSEAQRARAIEQRKSPIYRASHLVLPVMRRIVGRADHLASAMEARCFDENRPTPPLKMGVADWQATTVVVSICLLLFLT